MFSRTTIYSNSPRRLTSIADLQFALTTSTSTTAYPLQAPTVSQEPVPLHLSIPSTTNRTPLGIESTSTCRGILTHSTYHVCRDSQRGCHPRRMPCSAGNCSDLRRNRPTRLCRTRYAGQRYKGAFWRRYGDCKGCISKTCTALNAPGAP